MKPYYEHAGITIYHGDCREVLPQLPDVDVVITDPPYSSGRTEMEFAATGNIAVALHLASEKAKTMLVFGTSSGRGYEFIRSSIRRLPHCRTLAWHRSFVNSPAAGPWRWDLVLVHVFGRGAFGRPEHSSLMQTNGTAALANEVEHRAPVPVGVMTWLYRPFAPGMLLDPFCGSGASLLAAKLLSGRAIGIEIEERYCEIAAKRLAQEVLPL
ncbi:MAG TPA: DNA methyltransferase [Thermodesulfobacteriota bacterium]